MRKVTNIFIKLFLIEKRLKRKNSLRFFSSPPFKTKTNIKDRLKNLTFKLFNYFINKTILYI